MRPDPPYGPYVPDEGGDLEFTIFVKAGPERSKQYGATVCTAGILDDGRLIRIYPVEWETYAGGEFPKWSRVSATVEPSDEPARRPESHKLQGEFTKLESPLCRDGGDTPWQARSELIQKGVNPRGIQGLRDEQEENRTSLGIVPVKELVDFRITSELDDIVDQANFRESPQATLTGDRLKEGSKIDEIKHVFRYRWRCPGSCCDGKFHDTTCEDWELFQAFRSWRRNYDDAELLDALGNMFYECMGQSDLHFVMGTPSHPAYQSSWMIVGLFYPGRPQNPDPRRSTLCSQSLSPDDILDVDSSMDDVAETSAERGDAEGPRGPLDAFMAD